MNDALVMPDPTRSDPPAVVKCPARLISYAWGAEYVDILLTLTLPSLLAPGNLPFIAAEVPCTLVILTERRFFPKFNAHPVTSEIRKHCPVRLIALDDLLVSKDKYGMSLTYVLHRGFSDLGSEMTNQWQIFLNADFILADGSLKTLFGVLAGGKRIVASPSYCVNAEDVIFELRRRIDPSNWALCVPHRELARLILKHRHTVIRGKTVNQSEFHMRYMDQFYWEVDSDTLIGCQMPVAIVGLRPERCVAEPNSYWDYGFIREYCPSAEICVLADSDQFTMLELRNRAVAEDQIVSGPADLGEIAQRMITWVTPYQHDFLKFLLMLHSVDVPPSAEEGRRKLQAFTDEVMSRTPTFPSHLRHPQWEYHWTGFKRGRRTFLRRTYLACRKICLEVPANYLDGFRPYVVEQLVALRSRTVGTIRRLVLRPVANRFLIPVLRRRGLQIIHTAELVARNERIHQLATDLAVAEAGLQARDAQITDLDSRVSKLATELAGTDSRISDLKNFVSEYQFKLERSYDYQSIMVQDQIKQGLSHLNPEFLSLYQLCREYTMTSWERLYALYESVRYIVENGIPGDIIECGVWRGGSMKLAAHVLLSMGKSDRNLVLCDTYEGMTKPDADIDIDCYGNKALNDWAEIQRRGVKWSYAPLEEVRHTMADTGYPTERIHLVKGPVEETIPEKVGSAKIALLRLDTDWYASTKHEIENLYPLLSPQGILIIDDYGQYRGSARAVDEYFARLAKKPLLLRVDQSCRLAIKPVS